MRRNCTTHNCDCFHSHAILSIKFTVCSEDGGSNSFKQFICFFQPTWHYIPLDSTLHRYVLLCTYWMIMVYLKPIVLSISVVGKKQNSLPVKIQCDSCSFDFADMNVTTKLPYHPPKLRRRYYIQKLRL
jgi:hypothetical protein